MKYASAYLLAFVMVVASFMLIVKLTQPDPTKLCRQMATIYGSIVKMRDNGFPLDKARRVVTEATGENLVSAVAERMVITAYDNPDKSGEVLENEMIARCVSQQ